MQQVTETLEALLKCQNAGRRQIRRQYETTCGSRFLIVDPFTGLLPEVTAEESGMPLVVKSVSQGDELNASWFNIIRWLITIRQLLHRQTAWGYGTTVAIQLENPIARLFDALSIANRGSFIIT